MLTKNEVFDSAIIINSLCAVNGNNLFFSYCMHYISEQNSQLSHLKKLRFGV